MTQKPKQKVLDKTINNSNQYNEQPMEKLLGSSTPFFNGVDDSYGFTLGSPLVNGPFYFMFWDRLPNWFQTDPDLKYFQRLSQLNFRSWDGYSEITASPLTVTTGATGATMNIPGDINNQNAEFSTSYLEYTRSPMRRMIEKFFAAANGDPRTGATLLAEMGLEYHPLNYTGNVLIMMVRKDFNNPNINPVEFAVYYPAVYPTNISGESGMSYQLGQQTIVEGMINWAASTAERGPKVEAYAWEVLKQHIINPNSPWYIKYVDSMSANKDAIDAISDTDKYIAEIFKK